MDREARIMIGTGMQGVGKSHLTKQMIEQYREWHPNRPIFIIDPNDEDHWSVYKPIFFDIYEVMIAYDEYKKNKERMPMQVTKTEKIVKGIQKGTWRISGKDKYNKKMNQRQMEVLLAKMMDWGYSCLLFVDDVNTFITRWDREEITNLFNNRRHRSQDQIFHIQSLKPIPPIWYTVGALIRMQYDTYGIEKLEEKLEEHYTICKIAHICVTIMYEKHYNHKEGSKEYYAFKSFCAYVDLQNKRITGVPSIVAIEAIKIFLTTNNKKVKEQAKIIAERKGRLNYKIDDLLEAKDKIGARIQQLYLR